MANYKFIKLDNKIIALSKDAGSTVKGVAKCNPEDTYSEEFGQKLAAARCNLKVAKRRVARAEKTVKDANINYVSALRGKRRAHDFYEDACNAQEAAQELLTKLMSET